MISSHILKNERAMLYPPPLSKGDCIGLVALASPISKAERDGCVKILTELGFQVRLSKGLRGENGACLRPEEGGGHSGLSYLAGDARQRADELNQMFHDRRIQAVFCVRGGYGSAELLPFLDYRGIRRNPKIFVGYSDMTAIHLALQCRSGLVTFHGPMVKSNLIGPKFQEERPKSQEEREGWHTYQWESLWKMIGRDGELADSGRAVFQNPPGEKIRFLCGPDTGRIRGTLAGGNLSVLVKLAGTGYLPGLQGKILFLEDVGESAARIHMNLIQLEQMGVFHKVQGVLLGDFTGCGAEVEEMLEYFFRDKRITVLENIHSDHRPGMGTLPLGAFCEIWPANRRLVFLTKL